MISSQLARPVMVILGCMFFVVIGLNAQENKSIAVLDLEGQGISSYELASLTERLRSELSLASSRVLACHYVGKGNKSC